MIQLNKNYSLPERLAEFIPIKIVSVGGAGLNALDRIVLDGLERADVVAINTDVTSLTSSVATRKVQLGRSVSRGLGAGGDPDVGYQAALESAEEIREALADASVIFICAGLGGGTGSGAAPYIAQAAREAGALVIGFATLPFGFEGKRRNVQAREALVRLSEFAHAVVCFENDRMGDLSPPQAGIHQAFAMADITISQNVRSIVNLIQQPGLIRIGFDDLLAALHTRNSRCLFGYGESDSDNRAHEALTQALKNPLMDRGRMLADATHVLVQVAGGPGMTLSEVEILMQQLGRHVSDQTQILFGAVVDAKQFRCKPLQPQAVRLQYLRLENNTKPQHRDPKFNVKNRLSKFDLTRKRFHSKNLSRQKRHHSQHPSRSNHRRHPLVTASRGTR